MLQSSWIHNFILVGAYKPKPYILSVVGLSWKVLSTNLNFSTVCIIMRSNILNDEYRTKLFRTGRSLSSGVVMFVWILPPQPYPSVEGLHLKISYIIYSPGFRSDIIFRVRKIEVQCRFSKLLVNVDKYQVIAGRLLAIPVTWRCS